VGAARGAVAAGRGTVEPGGGVVGDWTEQAENREEVTIKRRAAMK